MAKLTFIAGDNGRALPNATISVYDEDETVAEGSEDTGFDTLSTSVFADDQLTTAVANPGSTSQFGEFVLHATSGSRFAVKVSKTGYGTRWYRGVEMLGSDAV